MEVGRWSSISNISKHCPTTLYELAMAWTLLQWNCVRIATSIFVFSFSRLRFFIPYDTTVVQVVIDLWNWIWPYFVIRFKHVRPYAILVLWTKYRSELWTNKFWLAKTITLLKTERIRSDIYIDQISHRWHILHTISIKFGEENRTDFVYSAYIFVSPVLRIYVTDEVCFTTSL